MADASTFPPPLLSGFDLVEQPIAIDRVGDIWLAQVQEWATGGFGVMLYYADAPWLAIVLPYEDLDRMIEELRRVRAGEPTPASSAKPDQAENEVTS